MRYQFERCGNPEYTAIHVDKRLVDGHGESYYDQHQDKDKRPGYVNHLLGIAGVTEVKLQPYRIVLKKARVFDWDNILLCSLEILKVYLMESGEEAVEKGSIIREDKVMEKLHTETSQPLDGLL